MIAAIRSAIAAIAAAVSVSGGAAPVAVSAAQPPAILRLNGVACASAAHCLAVGQDVTDQRGFAESWDGGGWLVLQPAYPVGAEAVLTDVACPSPARCVAVGDYDYTTGELPFADVWNGRQWRLLKMPGI